MRKLTLLTTLGLSLLLMSSCNSKVSDEALTEENYLHEDSLLWITFNNETWRIIGVFDGYTKIIKETHLDKIVTWDGSKRNCKSLQCKILCSRK